MLLTEKIIEQPEIEPKLPKKHYGKYLFWALIVLGIYFALRYTFEENVELKDGKFVLKSKRIEQFQKDSAKLENCEQYALFAEFDGWYPCYSCVDADSVYLLAGEVWKYGVHCHKDRDRYAKGNLKTEKLKYLPQFIGSLQECLLAEKAKIIYYPLLPENLKRIKPLGHPPGNKNNN